jgi:hypothetical protein
MKRFVTRALLVVAAILGIVFAQVAPASATPANKLASTLAASWTAVLQTPADRSPYGSGGPETGCVDLGGTLAPGWPFGFTGVRSCTVKPGTKIFVTAASFECSTIPGDDGGPGLTEDQLRACASDLTLKVAPTAPTVTLDGRSVQITEVETQLFNIVLPAGNIFNNPPVNPVPGGTAGKSVAHGWVALLHPLTPGTHTIVISGVNITENTTTIVVKPGH